MVRCNVWLLCHFYTYTCGFVYTYFRTGQNYTQRLRVWLVALARSKLVKENEPEENP